MLWVALIIWTLAGLPAVWHLTADQPQWYRLYTAVVFLPSYVLLMLLFGLACGVCCLLDD